MTCILSAEGVKNWGWGGGVGKITMFHGRKPETYEANYSPKVWKDERKKN